MSEPKWMEEARRHRGLAEIPGAPTNSTIAKWLGELKAWWRDDETPWCGTFVAHCMQVAGIERPRDWMRAKAWADWGVNVPTKKAVPGTVLVFQRPGGGHVGFYAGEDSLRFYVLGGNQGNKVSIVPIDKSRCIAARWPAGILLEGEMVFISSATSASKNEA